MIKRLKTITAPPGSFVMRRSRSGAVRSRICRHWSLWAVYNRQGHLIQLLSEPVTSVTRTLPESMQEGFIRFMVQELPGGLYL